MKNRKIYIFLILIFVVFFCVMFYLFGIDEMKSQKQSLTVLLGHNTVWQYKGKQWLNLSKNLSHYDLNWKKYHVYSNQEYVGDYLLWHDDKWYAFDDNKEAILLEGDLLAYMGNYKLSFYPFSEEEIEDYSSVYDVLKKYNVSLSSELTAAYHVSFDFDQDGSLEDFYIISNAFAQDEVDTTFSFVYMIKDNQLSMIYEYLDGGNSFNVCKPYFTSFLDVNEDSIYEIILSCGGFSISEPIHMLYQYRDNAFKIAISSE